MAVQWHTDGQQRLRLLLSLLLLARIAHAFLLPAPSHSPSRLGSGEDQGDFDIVDSDDGNDPPAAPSDMLARIMQGAQQRRASSGEGGDWAVYSSALRGGVVLVANPAVFLAGPPAGLASRFLLPSDLSLGLFSSFGGGGQQAIDNLANILPVVLLLGSGSGGTSGLVLNRRTGYLVGDLNVDSSGFKIQPVHLGGTGESDGIFMIHTYPELERATQVTNDGLFFGGNYTAAQELVREQGASSSRFKFFIQQTLWAPGELKREIEDKVWYPAQVSKDVILKNRGREGPKMAKPLWTEVLELMGGSFLEIKKELYENKGRRWTGEGDEEV
uniref:Uncharacterized protein n=1 Tax=Nannochloropsis gaditana (strain CCMP526) TaxID=1093141 RepID=I2CSD8_NANGC